MRLQNGISSFDKYQYKSIARIYMTEAQKVYTKNMLRTAVFDLRANKYRFRFVSFPFPGKI